MSQPHPLLLKDDVLGLRAPEPEDAGAYQAFRNDLGAVGDLIGYVRGVPRHKIHDWIAKIDNKNTLTLTAVLLSDNRPIGYINVGEVEPKAGTCEMGLAVFAPEDGG